RIRAIATLGASTGLQQFTASAAGIDPVVFTVTATNSLATTSSVINVITTVAGTGTIGFSGDESAAPDARLNYPKGVSVDSSGNIFVADYANNRIRRVTPAGTISTV